VAQRPCAHCGELFDDASKLVCPHCGAEVDFTYGEAPDYDPADEPSYEETLEREGLSGGPKTGCLLLLLAPAALFPAILSLLLV
jgi:predicted  nucleic acid-binding Zn-ribbon protein